MGSKQEIGNMGRFQRLLAHVERAGNALPHPAVLFLLLSAVVVLVSAIFASMGIEAVHPVKNEPVRVLNLLSAAGMQLILTDMVKNFSGFAPLGTVLVAMLGFSVAEKSGLIPALMRLLVLKSPKPLLIPAILLAGVLSHTAGDVGYVLLIPLAGMAFHSAGLNPIAGIAVCFAGVSGGFAANFLLSTADPLLSGLSQEAARIIDPKYVVTPVANYYFMATSSLLIVVLGTIVALKITIPFAGEYKGDAAKDEMKPLTPDERRGLLGSALIAVLLAVFFVAGSADESGFLRDGKSDIFHSPVLKGVVAIVFLMGSLTGLGYGYLSKKFKNHGDVVNAMQDAMTTMAPYLVLVFFASQFIALFNASNVGLVLAIKGSAALKATGLGIMPLMFGFIILTCLLDLVIGSASAKWALMAPVVVPMFMLLGISPELTQTAYRIADSVVNIISPLMSYFPLILAMIIRYDRQAKVGTLLALMLPYSLTFLLFWTAMLLLWIAFGLPVGPGAPLAYPPA